MSRSRNLIFCTVGPGPGTVPFRKEPGATWDLVEVLWHPDMIADHQAGRYRTDADAVLYETDRTLRKFACFAGAWATLGPMGYEAVLIADDDLTPVGCTWSDVFALFQETGLNVAQPALAPGSTRISSAYVTHQQKTRWRQTNFVEVMMPIFTRAAVERLVPFFLEEKYGLGLEMLWRERFNPIGVLDATPVLHTRPLGSAHSMSGVDSHPWKQAEAFRAKHGLTNDHHYPVATLARYGEPPKLAPRVTKALPEHQATRKNLIVRQLGADRPAWHALPPDRSWDLLEFYFTKNEHVTAADMVVIDEEPTRRKLATFKALFTAPSPLAPTWATNVLRSYDNVILADDDVEPVGCSWNDIFERFEESGFEIGQPALAPGSFSSHGVTRQVKGLRWRVTDFAEVMCPIFTREALVRCIPVFDVTESGWSVDDAWMAIEDEAVVLDETPVLHDRPIGESYSAKLAAEEANAFLEGSRTPRTRKITLRLGPLCEGVARDVCWSCHTSTGTHLLSCVLLCKPCIAQAAMAAMGVAFR